MGDVDARERVKTWPNLWCENDRQRDDNTSLISRKLGEGASQERNPVSMSSSSVDSMREKLVERK
jgi:hypothetical protein